MTSSLARIGIGRIRTASPRWAKVVVCDWHNPDLKMRGRLTKLYDFQANGRQPCATTSPQVTS